MIKSYSFKVIEFPFVTLTYKAESEAAAIAKAKALLMLKYGKSFEVELINE